MSHQLADIPNLIRCENTSRDATFGKAAEMTHSVYPHDDVYGQFCTVQDYIDCPPEDVFTYLCNVHNLDEYTYSTRDFQPTGTPGLYVGWDTIADDTKIYMRLKPNREAMTLDYHCAWDQGEKLWMIYLMRVIPAQLVLNRPGSVVLWTNCRHPFYDKNPFPERGPIGRKVWVGDLWPFFYAGHHVEMQNLKHILEYRHANGLAINPREVRS